MLDCALREVSSASDNSALLPASGAAHIGSISHKLLDQAAKGHFFGASRADIGAIWDQMVATKDSELSANPVERPNVPLKRHVFRYAVRRIRTVKRVIELAADAGAPGSSGNAPPTSTEKWIESQDGKIGGFIDAIVPSPEGPVIRDYKTGSIMEESGSVRAEYSVQLKLYAALYFERHQRWPAALELVPLQGQPIRLPFSAIECIALLNEARQVFMETNAIIDRGQADLLASPTPATCRFCVYRPCCTAYRSARTAGDQAVSWPADVWGEVVSTEVAGDGRIAVVIANGNATEPLTTIIGLTPGGRHPALLGVQNSDMLSLFSLRATCAANTYTESPTTTIYRVAFQ
jgi:hypothetical protein